MRLVNAQEWHDEARPVKGPPEAAPFFFIVGQHSNAIGFQIYSN